jgi:predicted AlkP superfamily phosphohydrolase/phosphomutase
MKPKILVIGLDAATFDLIKPWAEAGHLPTLAGLIRGGAHGVLMSTPNMHSASAWTSILTGLNPGRHGLYVFSDRDFATGRQVFFKGGDRTGDTIAAHLARHGLTAGLMNVPMTYPPTSTAAGFMISGLDAPSLNQHAFSPASLRDQLVERFPEYTFTPPGLSDLMGAGRLNEATNLWLKLTQTQTAAARYLIERYPTDFFMTVYTASDWAGHNLWTHVEPSLLEVYKALDEGVSRLLDYAGDGAQVYVVSDHGMGPHTGASYHLAAWLEQNGFLSRGRPTSTPSSLTNVVTRTARRVLPPAVRNGLKSMMGIHRVRRMQTAEKDSFYSSIDWDHTLAYTEPGRHVININLAGRNICGVVREADYDRVCGELIGRLLEWKDDGGAAVVEKVARREDSYWGEFASRASDLYVHWNPAARLGDPPPEVQARGFWWRGDHRPEGILVARGPAICRGKVLPSTSVYDLVPTILYLAGLPVPEGLDGRVIDEMCDEEFRAANPVKTHSPAAAEAHRPGTLSKSEEEQIQEKLRGLGYM